MLSVISTPVSDANLNESNVGAIVSTINNCCSELVTLPAISVKIAIQTN